MVFVSMPASVGGAFLPVPPTSMLYLGQLGTCQASQAWPARIPSWCWWGGCSEPHPPPGARAATDLL